MSSDALYAFALISLLVAVLFAWALVEDYPSLRSQYCAIASVCFFVLGIHLGNYAELVWIQEQPDGTPSMTAAQVVDAAAGDRR